MLSLATGADPNPRPTRWHGFCWLKNVIPWRGTPMRSEILLAETDPGTARIICNVLNETNPYFHVQVVPNGASALDYLFATGRFSSRDPALVPALIVLDVSPPTGGWAALRIIKSYIRTRHVPTVMLVEPTDEHAVCLGYELGANGCIAKSLDPECFGTNIASISKVWLTVRRDGVQSTSVRV